MTESHNTISNKNMPSDTGASAAPAGTKPGLKIARLANGKAQAVPKNLEILNPGEEGKRACLHFAWFLDVDDPEAHGTLDDSIMGKGVCHPFGYFSDNPDLYAVVRRDVPVRRSRLAALEEDWRELWGLMAKAAARELPAGSPWAYKVCLCDDTGASVPVGVSCLATPAADGGVD